MCRLLIYSGFNPKQRDNFGQTPLHLCCLSGNLNTVKVLVEQDVELEAVDFNGNSPRKLAEGRKHWETVRYLERSAAREVFRKNTFLNKDWIGIRNIPFETLKKAKVRYSYIRPSVRDFRSPWTKKNNDAFHAWNSDIPRLSNLFFTNTAYCYTRGISNR